MKGALASLLTLILLLAASGCNGKDGTGEDAAEDGDGDITDFTDTDSPGDPGEEDAAPEPLDDEPGEEPSMDAEMEEIEDEGAEDVAGEDAVEEDIVEDEGPFCGNDNKEGDEECDGEDLGSPEPDCTDYDFGSGTLRCLEDCSGFTFSECIDGCGNGIKEGTETCDGDDTGGETCITLHYGAGTLKCSSDCSSFDESGCSEDCTGLPDFTPCVVITDPDRSYDICIDRTCRSPGCGDASCNPPGPHFPLPDTNQRACYDDAGEIACSGTPGDPSCATTEWCGQDAQYGWDTSHEATERFTVTGTDEPVVTDNVTGLAWQGCPAGQSGSDCSGGSASTVNWANALSYCDGLTWADHDDWHLPDRYEFQSIVDYGRTNPSIDTSAFPGTLGTAYFWSSSSYAGSPSSAWYVDFYNGYVLHYDKGNVYAVRCVRSGGIGEERFTIEAGSEPVVTDNVTGLIWQGCPAGLNNSDCSTGSTIWQNWQTALSYCEGLDWGGHDDWYLPGIKEFASIVDDSRIDPSIDTSAFPRTPSTYFWSSSSFADSPSRAWHVYFNYGYVYYHDKDSVRAVRCVRVGP